jgi:hypothetical protein
MSTAIDDTATWLEPRLAWLSTVFAERLDAALQLRLRDGIVHLTMAGHTGSISFAQQADTFSRADSSLAMSWWNGAAEGWTAPLQRPLPAPGATALPSPLVRQADDGHVVGYDIPGLAYWMLSRQEEVGRLDLDNHGRFPATASHAHQHGYLERPVVDEWLDVLGQVMERQWPGFAMRKPEPAVVVSHDVDSASRYGFGGTGSLLRAMAGDVLKRRRPLDALRGLAMRAGSTRELHRSDPLNCFDWIMDESEKRGLVSAFYFICGRTDASRDALYDPEHPAIRSLLRRIHSRGHEIGLHPSYNSYRNPQVIADEANRLRRVCAEEGISQADWGGRMHFLRWETPTTMRAWADAGMRYDSSLSYADLPGFRCGTCFEYPAFDAVAGEPLKLRIRPLIAMECTVMADRYLGLGNGPDALARFVSLKQACVSVGGSFTTLWHNTVFESQDTRKLYQALLDA